MSKISKLLVMALVILAVVTMSVKVNAGTADLTNYVTSNHVLNGMMFEIDNSQKESVRNYITTNVTDAQADAAMAKINEAEKLVVDSGVNNIANLSATTKTKIISLAQEAATSVGLKLEVNTENNTYNLLNGTTSIASGKVEKAVANPGTGAAGATAAGAPAATTTGRTLLYTGANYAIYAVVVLAIVAVAVVVKKRA